LYVSNRGSNDLSGYAFDPNTGSLTPLSGSPFALGLSSPSSVATYPAGSGSVIYVTNSGGQAVPAASPGSISGFTISSTGTSFTNIAGSPFAAQVGPTGGLVFSASTFSNNYYYLETDSGSNTVSVYPIDFNTGALSAVVNSPFATGTAPSSVVGIHTFQAANETDVDYVYVANSGDGTISAYNMDSQTGTLGPLQPGTFPVAGPGLSALAATPDGVYLLASCAHGVSVFGTGAAGLPAPLGGSPFAAGAGPGPLVAYANYIYVVNTVDQTISVFTQDPDTHALRLVAGAAVQTGRTPSSIVVIGRPAFATG
jgi:6-phosphogluconolactonase (cycloisomerase 2 family)